METEFLPAEKLKRFYQVFGHFYSLELNAGDTVHCRSVLEIVDHSVLATAELAAVATRAPDAIFVMMNPGSSRPLAGDEECLAEAAIAELGIELVPTKPDTTQYQVMRVMHYAGWKHVRVLNLSDLRDPDSSRFADFYPELEQKGCTVHSVFADARQVELARQLRRPGGAPIVCAWGVSSDLDPLIARCLSRIKDEPGLLGLLKPGTQDKYFHPLPTLQVDKLRWISDMVQQVKAYQADLQDQPA